LPPNDRVHDLLEAEVLYSGQIGANVSEEKAASIFRVDQVAGFYKNLVSTKLYGHTSHKNAIYIALRNSSLNNLVRFSKLAEVG